MRSGFGPVLGRMVAVVAGLLLVGIVLRLIVAVLQPVLPAQFAHDLASGWGMLYGIVSPAIAPIAAVGILLAVVWVISALRR